MANAYEIPLVANPQTLSVAIGGASYNLKLAYHNVDQGGWTLDIADSSGKPLACGIPLVTGTDLLGQFGYLGIAGSLVVSTDGDPLAVPTFDNLGTTSHLRLITS